MVGKLILPVDKSVKFGCEIFEKSSKVGISVQSQGKVKRIMFLSIVISQGSCKVA